MSYIKYGPDCDDGPRQMDMFDFLEDAGRKLDRAGRELGEREAFGPAHFSTESGLEGLAEDSDGMRPPGRPWMGGGCGA